MIDSKPRIDARRKGSGARMAASCTRRGYFFCHTRYIVTELEEKPDA